MLVAARKKIALTLSLAVIAAAGVVVPPEARAQDAPAVQTTTGQEAGQLTPAPGTVLPVAPPAVTPPPVPGPAVPPPVPPPPPPRTMAYFVIVNGQSTGPFDQAALEQKAATGELVRTSLVWTGGMADWAEAKTIAELQPILDRIPPEPKFDGAAFMAGTWQSDPQQVPVPNVGTGTITGQTTYSRDGTYSAYGELSVMMQGQPLTQTIVAQGTYTAVEQGPNNLLLTLTGNLSMSMPGQPAMSQPQNETILLTIVDRNTLTNTKGVRSYRISN